MAQLKDTVVSGSLRATDTIYSTTNQFQILNIPTSSNGTTYGPGTSGQVLKSNGTSVYWASDTNTDSHVTQAAAITTAGAYPIILANSTSTAAVTATVNKTSTLTYNPNTKSLVTGGTVDGYTLAAASAKGVTDNTTNTDVTSSDTNLITGRTLYYQLAKKGYTTNTGTVTSITLKAGTGISLDTDNTAITTSGTRTISNSGVLSVNGKTGNVTLADLGLPATFSSSLVSSVDADTLTPSGKEISYYYATGSSGSSNLPWTSNSAFSLYTYPTGSTNRAQECTAVISGDGHHYIRWSTSSGWTNWYEHLLSNQGIMNTTILSDGTVTAAVTSSPYKPIKWTFNLDSDLTIKNGTTIFIKTPSDGHTNGIFLSLDGGTTYYPICTRKTARLATEFASGTLLMLAFDSSGSAASMYPLEGGTSRVTVTGGVWNILNYRDDNTYTSSLCTTAAATAAKTAASSNFVLKANTYIYLVIYYANTAQSALTLNINSTGAKPVWINGVVSSSTNYTWPAGSYLIYYDGTNYYVNTDGTVYGVPSIALGKSVPEMPFTDFDDIAIPSTYRIKNSATLKEITNSPLGNNSNSGGRIITMGGYTTTDNTYLRQFFFGSYYRMWIRGQSGTGTNLEWSPWVLMVTASPEGNIGDTNIPVYINSNGLALPATNVYNKNNIVYSSTAPANPTDGMIWLKPIS